LGVEQSEFLRNDEACEETLFAQINWGSAGTLAKFLKNDEAYEETGLAQGVGVPN
jgi:hypothetical protein